jgi:hypothetical protein
MLCSERAGCSASNPIGVDESKVTSQLALILGTLRMPARAGTAVRPKWPTGPSAFSSFSGAVIIHSGCSDEVLCGRRTR